GGSGVPSTSCPLPCRPKRIPLIPRPAAESALVLHRYKKCARCDATQGLPEKRSGSRVCKRHRQAALGDRQCVAPGLLVERAEKLEVGTHLAFPRSRVPGFHRRAAPTAVLR